MHVLNTSGQISTNLCMAIAVFCGTLVRCESVKTESVWQGNNSFLAAVKLAKRRCTVCHNHVLYTITSQCRALAA